MLEHFLAPLPKGGCRGEAVTGGYLVLQKPKCIPPPPFGGPRQIVKSSATLFRNKLYRREITQTFSWSVID